MQLSRAHRVRALPIGLHFGPCDASTPGRLPRRPDRRSTGLCLRRKGLRHNHEIPIVIGLKLEDRANQSRFTLEFSDPVAARSFLLTDPNRIVVDCPKCCGGRRKRRHHRPEALSGITATGMFRKGNARLVLDLNRPVKVEKPQILPPADGAGFRLVMDLSPATQTEFSAHAGWPHGSEFAPRQGRRPETLSQDTARSAGHHPRSGPWRDRSRHAWPNRSAGKGPRALRRQALAENA